jgi:hypothetical protein
MTPRAKRERVVLETARHRIVGDVTLPAEGYQGRLSDLLNREGLRFISLADAEIRDLNGGEPERLPFIAVAREHVQVAFEDPR